MTPPGTDPRSSFGKGHAPRRTPILAVCILATVALGATTSAYFEKEVIRAQKIQLVDAKGNVRAELGIDADGSAGLFLRDVEGRTRGALIHDDNQSALYLFDEDETIRVGASQFAHGGGGFALHGPKSKGATVLYHKGAGALSLYDDEGKVVHRFPKN